MVDVITIGGPQEMEGKLFALQQGYRSLEMAERTVPPFAYFEPGAIPEVTVKRHRYDVHVWPGKTYVAVHQDMKPEEALRRVLEVFVRAAEAYHK